MIWRNTQERFGAVQKGFHWIIAFLVIGVIGMGLYMTRMEPPSPAMFQLYALHKSIGITILALAVLRVLWRFGNIHPVPLPSHAQWERMMARAVHLLLYLALFLLPISGWLMSSAKGFSVSVFGLFTLPDMIRPSDDMAALMVLAHVTVAYSLIVLIGVHVAGALKHHFMDRDMTLLRMLPLGKISKE